MGQNYRRIKKKRQGKKIKILKVGTIKKIEGVINQTKTWNDSRINFINNSQFVI
jgi:hypothetical protein